MKRRIEGVLLLVAFLPILYVRLSVLPTTDRTVWDCGYRLPLVFVGGGIVLLASWVVTVLGGVGWTWLLTWSGRLLITGIVTSYLVSGYFFFTQTSAISI